MLQSENHSASEGFFSASQVFNILFELSEWMSLTD